MDEQELRYADGPTTQCTIDINASASVVWALISDIDLPARFSTEFKGATFCDGATQPGLGVSFTGRNEHRAIGSWETTSTITEFEPMRTFGYAVGDPADASSAWRFTIEAEGSLVRLTQWMRMGPARSGINFAIDAMPEKESKIIGRRLAEHRENMVRTLEGIRDLAEITLANS
jgi:hypothetical protein